MTEEQKLRYELLRAAKDVEQAQEYYNFIMSGESKMAKIATDIEQSRKLLELGLDPKSADMRYVYFGKEDYGLEVANEFDDKLNKLFNAETIPAWTLSALLETMPSIQLDKLSGLYSLEYADKFTDDHLDPIDAVVEMMEWMLDKGYISKSDEITEGGDK